MLRYSGLKKLHIDSEGGKHISGEKCRFKHFSCNDGTKKPNIREQITQILCSKENIYFNTDLHRKL